MKVYEKCDEMNVTLFHMEMARKDRYDKQRNVKRKKRNRETEDKLVSTSEIRTLLFRAQRSEAESEFEKSDRKM